MVDIIFALGQTNNNTPNKLLLSESAVSCLLRVRSVSFTSRAKGCIKCVPHSCLVSLSFSQRKPYFILFMPNAQLCQDSNNNRLLTLLYGYNFNPIKNTHLRHVTVHYFSRIVQPEAVFFPYWTSKTIFFSYCTLCKGSNSLVFVFCQ